MVVKVHGGIFDNQSLQGGLRYFDIEEANMTVNAIGDVTGTVAEVQILEAGSGHAAADILTLTGGTGTQATLTIDSITAGGAINEFSITTVGAYTALPTNPITVTSSGSGVPLADIINVLFNSTVIIPNAGTNLLDYHVPYGKSVVGSAVDQVLNEVSTFGTIVQIAIVDVDTVRVVLENDSMAWDQPGGGNAAADMQTAIQALGTVDVPDTTASGGTFALAAATVTERTLVAFAP